MKNLRMWLFRGLVTVSAGLMLWSWFQTWWACWVEEFGVDMVKIYPYGLWINERAAGGFKTYITGYEMPVWFAPLMWIYLGICVAALLYSLLAKERTVHLGKLKLSLPQVLIGLVGVSYIVVVVLAVIIIAIRAGSYFDTPLQGTFLISIGYPFESNATSRLDFGYWLACGVGPLCIALALLRNRIIGKPKLNIRNAEKSLTKEASV